MAFHADSRRQNRQDSLCFPSLENICSGTAPLGRSTPSCLNTERAFPDAQPAPAGRTCIWGCSSGWLERTPDKREVGGSIPPSPTLACQAGL